MNAALSQLSSVVAQALSGDRAARPRPKKAKYVPGRIGQMFLDKFNNLPQRLARQTERCAVCNGPATHQTGRSSGAVFVHPLDCGHPVYPLATGPRELRRVDWFELRAMHVASQDHARETRLNLDPPGQDKKRRRRS